VSLVIDIPQFHVVTKGTPILQTISTIAENGRWVTESGHRKEVAVILLGPPKQNKTFVLFYCTLTEAGSLGLVRKY